MHVSCYPYYTLWAIKKEPAYFVCNFAKNQRISDEVTDKNMLAPLYGPCCVMVVSLGERLEKNDGTMKILCWLIELWFNVPFDTNRVISETNKSTHWPIKRNVQLEINKKTKAKFSYLLQHLAWKLIGPILVSALHKFVTYLFTYPLTYSPGTHMGQRYCVVLMINSFDSHVAPLSKSCVHICVAKMCLFHFSFSFLVACVLWSIIFTRCSANK